MVCLPFHPHHRMLHHWNPTDAKKTYIPIHIEPKSRFEFVLQATEKFEFLDLVDFRNVAFVVESVIRVTLHMLLNLTLHPQLNTLQHTATHCNTLPHTTTHCNTLRHTATHCHTLQHTPTHYNTLQHTATHCNTLQHTATHCNTLQHTATHCNTLQHVSTHCHTLNPQLNTLTPSSLSILHSTLHMYSTRR